MRFRRKPRLDPAETARQLREHAFSVTAAELGLRPSPGGSRVWAVLMESGYPEAVASLVSLADDTTSLYFSNGGGVIGGGQHASVRGAAQKFLETAESHIEKFAPAAEHPLPRRGRVRFYVRTFDGLLTAEADERELEQPHALSPIFHAGHAVIAELQRLPAATR